MTNQRIPILTIGLLVMLIGLHWLVADKTLLYFSATDITRGETWRFISGHFMHADTQHLLWNCLGLAVLGALIEQHSRVLLGLALGVGIISVSTLLLTPFSQLQYYCGLSGVLNTLLLIALWLEWTRTRSWLIIAITFGSIMKAVIEVSLGTSVVTHISWPPYAWSHVAGLLGGLAIVWIVSRKHQQSATRTIRRMFHGFPQRIHRDGSNQASHEYTNEPGENSKHSPC